MDPRHREIVRHGFVGGRYADHGLDLDAATELVAYKQILIETAKELWRSKHPNRVRLPKNFEDEIRLKFYEICPGSAVVPIVREFPTNSQLSIVDEIAEAAELVSDAIASVGAGCSLPSNFPKSVLPLFEGYGKNLRKDESFQLSTSASSRVVSYTKTSRRKLSGWGRSQYEDIVDSVGKVIMARVDRPRMAIELSDGTEVEAAFLEEDEGKVLEALKKHEQVKVRIVGKGIFDSVGSIHRISEVTKLDLLPEGEIEFDEEAKPIWDVFCDLVSQVPQNEFDTLPTDLSVNHDKYLYGRKKAEP